MTDRSKKEPVGFILTEEFCRALDAFRVGRRAITMDTLLPLWREINKLAIFDDVRSVQQTEFHVEPAIAARLNRLMRLGRGMKWTDYGVPALDDAGTKAALEEMFEIFFYDAFTAARVEEKRNSP